jgi:Ca-activated chloride channel family protein
MDLRGPKRILLLAMCLAFLGTPVASQTDDPVHIEPHSDSATKSKHEVLNTHQRPFVADVDLVLVPVTVTDTLNRFVTGLEQEHFKILEDKVPQTIRYFYTQDTPISVGLIFDVSGSMSNAVDYSRIALEEFMQTANPQDEFFLISFSSKPHLLKNFTHKDDEITTELLTARIGGRTSLLDAIYLGLSKMREAKYPRKALLVITDGGDNSSRYTQKEVLRVLREADVQLYTIGIQGQDYAPYFLLQMTKNSGGRIYEGFDWADTASKISIELRNQYVLGYVPRNKTQDGKWRNIKVKLNAPKGLPELQVYLKNGYYAPEQ